MKRGRPIGLAKLSKTFYWAFTTPWDLLPCCAAVNRNTATLTSNGVVTVTMGFGSAMFKRFLRNESGSYVIVAGVLMLPLLLAIGLAVDYSRYLNAESHLQHVADGASLALSASGEKTETELRDLADRFVSANFSANHLEGVDITTLDTKNDQIDLGLTGRMKTAFMGLANIHSLTVRASSLSERAVMGSVEAVLVLDNTWSMSETDAKGVSRLVSLKKAAALVEEILGNERAVARIGLVPYADYVNVGTAHRHASWLDVEDDYTVQPTARVCHDEERDVCVANAPKSACTKYVDGVPEASTCGGACTTTERRTVEVCTGGGTVTDYKWYGCVGSRMAGNSRLSDGSPSVRYPGYVETSQRCLNPIVPLSADKDALLAAINGMIINRGSYKPYTYIPAGLIWGQNLLSASEPFTQGAAYDLANVSPRKVAILMTDGDNTLRFTSNDGRHKALSSNTLTAETQVAATNNDTASICAYMKSNNIEIFTVAFMVDNSDAKSLLEGCASDSQHYYDASDSEKLQAAFSGIAESLSQVRLAR